MEDVVSEEEMITSRLTGRAQTTIPKAVRAALELREGDEIVYVVEAGRVSMTRAAGRLTDDPFATFTEWDGEADRKAYADL